MYTVLVIIHVIVAIAMILIVLLQSGKGSDMGAAFGGGSSQTLFGASGSATFLSKVTWAAAIVFILTSILLAYLSTNRNVSVINFNQTPPPVTYPTDGANQ